MLGAAGLWGTVGPAQVLASSALGSGAVGAWRLLVGGIMLAAWSRPWSRSLLSAGLRSWRVWGWILIAAIATAGYQLCFLACVDRLGAALATAVALGCAPAATGVFAVWLASEHLDRRWYVGGALSVVGCSMLLIPGSGASATDIRGLVLGVVSGSCYGAYTVAAKRMSRLDVDPGAAVALTLLLGALILAPAAVSDTGGLSDPSTVLLIAWIGVGATGLAYALFITGLRTTDASTVGVLSLVEPLVAAALGLVVLGESLSLPASIGGLILLAGVVLVSVPSRSAPPSQTSRRTSSLVRS